MRTFRLRIVSKSEATSVQLSLPNFYGLHGQGLYPRTAQTIFNAAARAHIALIDDENGDIAAAGCIFAHPNDPPDILVDPYGANPPPQAKYLEFGGDLVRADCVRWGLHADLIVARTLVSLLEPPKELTYAICRGTPQPAVSLHNYNRLDFDERMPDQDVLDAAQYQGVTLSTFPDPFRFVVLPKDDAALVRHGVRALDILSEPVRTRVTDGEQAQIKADRLLKDWPLFEPLARGLAAGQGAGP